MEQTIENTPDTTPAVVPAPEKTTRVAKAKVEVNGNVLTFVFADGSGKITIDVAALPQSMQDRGKVHGIEQKVRDSYAGSKSAIEAYGMALKVVDQLSTGEWNAKGEGKGEEDSIEKLVRAVFNALLGQGKTEGEATAKAESVRGFDKTKRAAVRSIPAVAVELAKLKTSAMSLDEL